MAATAIARPAPTNFGAYGVIASAAPVKLETSGTDGCVLEGAGTNEVPHVDGLTSVVMGAGVVGTTGTTVDCSALDQSLHGFGPSV